MRTQLRPLVGSRRSFVARVECFGNTGPGGTGRKTAVLTGVHTDEGQDSRYVTDHVWVLVTKNMERVGIAKGDAMRFDAVVDIYIRENELDYGLTSVMRPRKLTEQRDREWYNRLEARCKRKDIASMERALAATPVRGDRMRRAV